MIFWAGQGESDGIPVDSTVIFPWSHRLRLFNPPDPMLTEVGGEEQALGLAILYEDLDGDRQWTHGEPVWAQAKSSVLLRYIPSDTGTAAAEDFTLIEGACADGIFETTPRSTQTELHLQLGGNPAVLPDLDCDGVTLEDGEWTGLCDGECVAYEE